MFPWMSNAKEEEEEGYMFNPDILVNRMDLLMRLTQHMEEKDRERYLNQAAAIVLQSVEVPLQQDMADRRIVH